MLTTLQKLHKQIRQHKIAVTETTINRNLSAKCLQNRKTLVFINDTNNRTQRYTVVRILRKQRHGRAPSPHMRSLYRALFEAVATNSNNQNETALNCTRRSNTGAQNITSQRALDIPIIGQDTNKSGWTISHQNAFLSATFSFPSSAHCKGVENSLLKIIGPCDLTVSKFCQACKHKPNENPSMKNIWRRRLAGRFSDSDFRAIATVGCVYVWTVLSTFRPRQLHSTACYELKFDIHLSWPQDGSPIANLK